MTASELAAKFGTKFRGSHPVCRARCPAHRSRGLTLALRAGRDRVSITCHAGCHSDDVLAAVGLTWQDTLYEQRQKPDPKTWAEQKRKRKAEEYRASQLRIGTWILRFIENGYTREDRDSDMTVIAACVIVLSNKSIPHWEHLFRTTMERIAAAEHCCSLKMLPRTL
jgi:hypothetical protein